MSDFLLVVGIAGLAAGPTYLGEPLDLLTGLVMALGLALSSAPLAFVTIATAKRQGMLAEHRRLLGWMFVVALMSLALN